MQHEEVRGCERRFKLEVHGVGSSAPSACYDVLADPERWGACDSVTVSWEKKVKSSRQTQLYSQLPVSLSPSALAGSYSVSLQEGFRKAALTLWWLGGGEPQRLTQFETYEYTDRPPSEAPATLVPLEFALLPKPGAASGKAALLVRGMDDNPGIGHRGWRLLWLDLPEKITAGATPGVNWVRALPVFSSLPADIEEPVARQENSAGLEQLRKGQQGRARAHFESAVALAPAEPLARYNLACSLALSGQARAAMFQLVELLTKAPANVIAERKRRAAEDADLASLRGNPDFQRLVCAGPCPELRAASASSTALPSPSAAEVLTQHPSTTELPPSSVKAEPVVTPSTVNAPVPSASPPGPKGGACAQRQHAARGSGWLWFGAVWVLAVLARRRPVTQ